MLIGMCYWSALAVKTLAAGDFKAQASEAATKVDLVADGITRVDSVCGDHLGKQEARELGTYCFYNNLLGLGLTVF